MSFLIKNLKKIRNVLLVVTNLYVLFVVSLDECISVGESHGSWEDIDLGYFVSKLFMLMLFGNLSVFILIWIAKKLIQPNKQI